MKRLSIKAGAAGRTGDGNSLATVRAVLPYLWPPGRFDLKARIVLSLLALVASKVITVATPFAFKYAVDALNRPHGSETQPATAILLLSVPIALVLAYGVGRITMVVLAQIRDALFAKVGQRAVRELAISTFRHLHALSLEFHLERRTGGLSRIIAARHRGHRHGAALLAIQYLSDAARNRLCGRHPAWTFGWLYAAGHRAHRRSLYRLHLLPPPSGASASAAT